MFINIFFLLVMVAVSVLFGWLARRSWKTGNVVSKWAGTILSGLLSVLVGLLSILTVIGLVKAYSTRRTYRQHILHFLPLAQQGITPDWRR